MLSLNLKRHKGNLGAGWFACKNHSLNMSMWQGFLLGLGLGTTGIVIGKKQIKFMLFLSGGSLLDRY